MSEPLAPTKSGLSEAEAARRLAEHGPNELPSQGPRRLPAILIGVLSEPMFLLLVLGAGLYLLLGDLGEGLLLALFAALSVGLVVRQELRSEAALQALQALVAPTARVLRDGVQRSLSASLVVPGDWLLLAEGERIAADGVLRQAHDLQVDESLLSGESLPVEKRTAAVATTDAATSRAFAGSLVVRGHGLLEVLQTGRFTEAGKIGLSLNQIKREPSPLQRSITRIAKWFGLAAVLVSGLVWLLYGLLRGEWIDGALASIAVAMSLLPEEFPMVFAVFMALGAWRLAQHKVLARRSAVIEALGAATVLCVDKTGTLTENRMRLRAMDAGEGLVRLSGEESGLPEALHRLLEVGVLASRRESFDPMDRAVVQVADSTLAATEHLHDEWPLQRDYAISSDLLAMARVWQREDGRHCAAVKGAPEAVAQLCGLTAGQRHDVLERVDRMASEGLRVLAVAEAEVPGEAPDDLRELHFSLLGLLGFLDPLRPEAAGAVAEAHQAGIRVIMITGDFPATARAIASSAGIDCASGIVTGAQLASDAMSVKRWVSEANVFARVRPEQKLALVDALKAQGDVVAMTGDGVNDAPALKSAHIGLAMARGGTDVAREAASISLLDDNIGHIVAGVRMGRRIFDNLRKVMIYIVAIHVPVVGLALLPLLLGMPPLLLPMHVVLVEMVVDPICAVAFESEPEEPDIMRRPPRSAADPLLGWGQMLLGVLQGSFLLCACFGLFVLAGDQGLSEAQARSVTMIALTAGNLALVRINGARGATLPRLFEPGHAAFWAVAAAASAVVALCVFIAPLAKLFAFASPPPLWVIGAAACGLLVTLSFDLLKPHHWVQRTLGARVGTPSS